MFYEKTGEDKYIGPADGGVVPAGVDSRQMLDE
jgi:hypothetical protein